MENKISLYDAINTTAARWLMNLAKTNGRPLCFYDLNKKDPSHLWLLNMADAFSVYNGYCDYYVHCGFFTYLYLRYIKKHRHLRRHAYEYICKIKTDVFIKDVTDAYFVYGVDKAEIVKLYNLFWGKD